MGTAERFTRREVQRILDLTEKQLEYWERLRLVRPRKRWGERFYDFRDLISLRTAKKLIEQGVSANRLRRAVTALERQLAHLQAPLTELRVLSNGRDLVVEQNGTRLEPISGQLLLNFDMQEIKSRLQVMPERTAEEWFALALELEAEPATQAEAIDAYRNVLAKDPHRLAALINLGALLYEQGDLEEAANAFRQAAELEPENALAHYNLGSVLEETEQLRAAQDHLRQAVRLKPDYSDAHYNLGVVCEKLGEFNEARQHWRRYIELDPSSPWCDYARRRLQAEQASSHPPSLPRRK